MIKNKKIIIIGGDPNSINSEIIFKTWKKLNKSVKKNIFIVANYELMKKQLYQLKYPLKLKIVKNLNEKSEKNVAKIINIDLKFKNPFKVSKKNAATYVENSLNIGHKLAMNKDVCGIVNCPINKHLLRKRNFGVTEFLANKCKIKSKSEVMMISNGNFSVCPITTHINVKNISKNIKFKTIITKVETIQKFFKNFYKRNPKIGILGLNPHNAEFEKRSEEVKQIIPAISHLKRSRFKVKGPLVADTIFISDYKNYDVIVGMYHDQVLSPFKTMYKFDAINITLGLKYLRVSPDHGVASNIIKKKVANHTSLYKCLMFLQKFGK